MARMSMFLSIALNVSLILLFATIAFKTSSSQVGAPISGIRAANMHTRMNVRRRLMRTSAADSAASAAPKTAPKSAPKPKPKPEPFVPPTLDPNTPMPRFQGNTGGLLRNAAFQEFYVITFESPKEQIFEMPTGGAAEMRKGKNLVKFARKEQCLALLTQLRTKFKLNGCVYRINQAKGGEVEYLHPKDGVYPEKIHPLAGETRGPAKLYNWETEPVTGPPLRCDVPRWAYGDEGQLAPTPLFFLWPIIYAYKFIFSEPPQYRYSDPEKLKIGPPEDWDMTAYMTKEE